MPNVVRLDIVADASLANKEMAQTTTAAGKMADGVGKSSDKMKKSWANVTSAAVFLTNGVSQLGDGIKAVTDLSRDGAIRADRLARAQLEVAQAAQDVSQAMADARQATLDYNQAQRDTAQAALDVQQAQLDAESAQRDYTDAVSEYGANSIEARQAQLDLAQANEDLTQAQQDAKQAAEDQSQALLDQSQAALDVTDAQIAMNETARDAIPPTGIQVWAERLQALSPLIFTAIGAMQLLTNVTLIQTAAAKVAAAAQVAWNFAVAISPVGLIILAIVALIAVFVLLWQKCEWFRAFWKFLWDAIKSQVELAVSLVKWIFENVLAPAFDWIADKAVGVFNFFKDLPRRIGGWLSGVGEIIKAAFRGALNWLIDRFNTFIGGINSGIRGFNAINPFRDVPQIPSLPRLHQGGVVPGIPGREVLAVLQAGETVSPRPGYGGGGDRVVLELRSSGSDVDNFLVTLLQRAVGARGGNVQAALGR